MIHFKLLTCTDTAAVGSEGPVFTGQLTSAGAASGVCGALRHRALLLARGSSVASLCHHLSLLRCLCTAHVSKYFISAGYIANLMETEGNGAFP